MRSPPTVVLLLAVACSGTTAEADWRQDRTPPAHVGVRPVFFVPAGEAGPTDAQRARLAQHLSWTRQRYVALLGAAGGFALDSGRAEVIPGLRSGNYYHSRPEQGGPEITGELLDHFKVSRFACPWIFVIVVMSPTVDQPSGGGRPINGGFNTGGGIVVISSFALDSIAFIQSTLRHELGHAFGLVHVDQYGRTMDTDSSLMSYNPAHHTTGFTESATPGTFANEDRAALALNQRAFPGLTYTGPTIPLLIGLVPMTITGHPDYTP